MRTIRTRSAIGLVAGVLVLAACGGGAGTGAGSESDQEALMIDVTEDTDTKPEFEVPDQDPPTELVTETVVQGDGEVAQTGDTVEMTYVGKSWSTGEQFDASWDRPPPQDIFTFQLGAGSVIAGWDQGIVGMKVGERRTLIIPPDLAYGASGRGPIGPSETLVFVVDLLGIQ